MSNVQMTEAVSYIISLAHTRIC